MPDDNAPASSEEDSRLPLCPFVTWTPTIGAGIVVRWFTHEAHMETCHPTVSASREVVIVHDARIRTSSEMNRLVALLDDALAVHGLILAGVDVKEFATHERAGSISGQYLPIGGDD